MKPILFNTEMVKAILDGRKSETRRVMKPQPYSEESDCVKFWHWKDCQWTDGGLGFPKSGIEDHAPYKPGDILYVRETWAKNENPESDNFGGYEYRTDYLGALCCDLIDWSPAIHMPKEAARIFLRVTDVYLQPLQEMTEKDAVAEGCVPVTCPTCFGIGDRCTDCNGTGAIEPALLDFACIWNSTLKKKDLPLYGWGANPWVWTIKFERGERDIV